MPADKEIKAAARINSLVFLIWGKTMNDKQIKKEFKIKASKEPDKYYATSVLKKEGFSRKKCTKCGTYFWSVANSDVCGNPACSGGFRFIGNTPAKKKLDYIGVWNEFSKLFKK